MVKERVDEWNAEDALAGRNIWCKALAWRNGELQSLLTVTLNFYEYKQFNMEGVVVDPLPVYHETADEV
ncbi:hypothetical protein HDU98_001571 [Podochytrium sp. JEL0797]|nr:hypothetical protein HDU98_001571 [Podochytrium sp. JEL0797]